ncbi:GCN5-related N-acetyltransferase [Citreicella sp. SE45]|uniref:Acetyltransferase (GNAT) domain-containing protein n=1 Tax=Salipiger thiooxidans TaxID=282683 RepID=A0A1G7EET3_9RHOB|nr:MULTISPECIES: GNAT family acetyltransferase [Salipiger]EEX12914.1 GCN5-related N-acetyltransferase [Citreicella sp. SE45]MAU47932.1 GNAT family N-acetyltransferase [Salipiger sp.]NVK62793.1 GNAT family N-acetyltransferase [Paracoccaceae bacterium]NIY96649.1 GNAT family N-acetyltransferase [Salipiger sp. HF18]SDE62161.1 Acetyltransferase (GNAT) domain-containing protein [Salipiger thiooxidans]
MNTVQHSPRLAGPDDVPGIAAVLNRWIDETTWMPRSMPPSDIEDIIRTALPDRNIWVLGDPIEAYLSLDPRVSKIGALYCSRTGEGCGKALMDRAKEGRDFLWLHTNVPNLGAQRFYRREGFEPVGGEIMPDPPETVPEIRMEWHR